MRERKKKQVVRCLEHLKSFIAQTVDRMHEGCIDPATAQLVLWDELADSLADLNRGAFENVLHMRVEGVANGNFLGISAKDIISVRYEGPRDGSGKDITYINIKVRNACHADKMVAQVRDLSLSVSSWSYGCHRTNNPHLTRMSD